MNDSSRTLPAAVVPWGEHSAAQAAEPRSPSAEERARATQLLEAGRVLAIPTETVYGLAVRGDLPEAVARLRAIKSREATQALTWHIGKLSDVERVGRVSPMVLRLAERYWPGPLTLVIPGIPPGLQDAASDGWIGVRLPAHATTTAWLAELPFPVVATSANRRGKKPFADAASIAREFAGEVELVLDGGAPRLAEPSLVLRVGPKHFEILRSGLIDLKRLRETAGLRLMFVCTGNTCRSPMAATLAQHALAQRLQIPPRRLGDFGFTVSSAGVAANFGAPMAANAVEVLKELAPELARSAREHRAHAAIPEELVRADRVYALTASHLDVLRSMLPPGRVRHTDLLDPDGNDVPDPIGANVSEYRRCRDHLARIIDRRLDEWA
ncbi:MAG TPA: L-threonylcarbamoyladenylate synthase [Planctomycetota bacterium]|nr:L-threonylcarbamoyladenylate synthase [Planctomycetota bacterium]